MKNLLVSLNDYDLHERLGRFAAGLARQGGAHLTGVYVVPALRLYPVVTVHVPPDVLEAQRKAFHKRGEEVGAAFREACADAGIECEWYLEESFTPLVADAVIAMGRMHDLVIAGQPSQEEEPDQEADFADRLVMECGRPVLFVPREGKAETAFRHIVVGWNGAREAARALHDSMEFLKAAETVELVHVNGEAESEADPAVDVERLAALLARHGVKARPRIISSAGHADAGAALMAHADAVDADLLVMGAWGHSRLREYVFGGATRHVLAGMTRPVLMSH